MPRSPLQQSLTSATGKFLAEPERTFFVVFCDSEHLVFWQRIFAKDDFRHCFVMNQMLGLCQVTEQTNYAILQHTYWNSLDEGEPLDAELLARAWAATGLCVLRVRTRFNHKNRVWGACNALPTCVNLCKNLMGINCWAQTPYQLYRWLLKENAEIVEGEL